MKLISKYYSNLNLNKIFSMIAIIMLLLIEISTSRKVTRIRCFECSTNYETEKYDCVHGTGHVFENPDLIRTDKNSEDASNNSSIKVVDCQHYCTIRRQEYADHIAGINFLNRSCEETKLDEVIVNGYFITYLRSCKSDLCNFGDGLESLSHIEEDELVPVESEPSKANSIYAYTTNSFIHIQLVFILVVLGFLFPFPFYIDFIRS